MAIYRFPIKFWVDISANTKKQAVEKLTKLGVVENGYEEDNAELISYQRDDSEPLK